MKNNIGFTLIIIIGIILSSCKPSEVAIKEAIAQTEAAQKPSETSTVTFIPEPTKTATNTVTPSPTSTITPTYTPTPIPIEERIIGKWSGSMTNKNGDKIPAFWTFMEGGVMIVEIIGLGYSYGAEWNIEGNRLNITTEMDPDKPTYRDVEFVSDDVMILTKEEADIKETWIRVTDE